MLSAMQVMFSAQLGHISRIDSNQSYDFEHQVLQGYPLNSQGKGRLL